MLVIMCLGNCWPEKIKNLHFVQDDETRFRTTNTNKCLQRAWNYDKIRALDM